LILLYVLGGKLRKFQLVPTASGNRASRKYYDEINALGRKLVLRNFESQAAMRMRDPEATEETRKRLMKPTYIYNIYIISSY
jgi:hypothetical protein